MMFIPKTEEISDMILLQKMVRIVKDNPKEQMLLLKACKRDCNIEYKGNDKAFFSWLEKLDYNLGEQIEEKIIDEQLKEEYKKEIKSKNDKPDETQSL